MSDLGTSSKEQTFHIIRPEKNDISRRQMVGEEYLSILDKVKRIAYYQQMHGISKGIKGFIFHGDVGVARHFASVCSELALLLISFMDRTSPDRFTDNLRLKFLMFSMKGKSIGIPLY